MTFPEFNCIFSDEIVKAMNPYPRYRNKPETSIDVWTPYEKRLWDLLPKHSWAVTNR